MIFCSLHDERFPYGFKNHLNLQFKPLWQLNAAEVVDALTVCQIAVEEAETNEAAARLTRLRTAIFYVLLELKVDVYSHPLPKLVELYWPGG